MGYVIEVTDGDTFTIQGGTRIRLSGVEAAELGAPYSIMAKEHLEKLILSKNIRYEQVSSSFDRIVANVWVDNTNVNKAMKSYIDRITP